LNFVTQKCVDYSLMFSNNTISYYIFQVKIVNNLLKAICLNTLICMANESIIIFKVIYVNKIIYEQTKSVITELCERAKLSNGSVVVVGCSTSEVVGDAIGTNSNFEVAGQIFDALYDFAKQKGIYLAIQCCEHLNRAIIIEHDALPFADQVNVVPQPKAGGSLATQAYNKFENPIVLEEIKADAGIDIGLTLIGMHLKKVAVPLRLENNKIGEALVVAARTRPKFIGGERAIYNAEML